MIILVMLAIATPPMVITTGELSIGLLEHGRWSSMDSPLSPQAPKVLVKASTVSAANRGDCYSLRLDGKAIRIHNQIMPYTDGGSSATGWFLKKTMGNPVWFGNRPTTRWKSIANQSGRESEIVRKFLASKAVANPKPHIHKIVRLDLDADGSDETLIYFGNTSLSSMDSELTGPIVNINPAYAGELLVRSAQGKEVVTALTWMESNINRTGSSGLDHYATFGGAWNLDGKPGLELITLCHRTYSVGARITNVINGNRRVLASAGGYRTGP